MMAQPNHKEQVFALLEEAYASRVNNLGHSVQLADKALSISRQTDDKALIGKSLSQLALFYMIMGEYDRSRSMSDEAINYFKGLNDEKGIADAKYNIASIYYKTDNFHLGLVYLIDCLGTYVKFNDYHNQARAQKSLGTIYEYFGDQNNAINAYESAIQAAAKAGDANLESNAYNPLSGIYLKQNKVEKALEIIERAIAMKQQSGDTRGLAFALYGRGKVFTHTGQYAQAEADFKEALNIHEAVGERLGTGMLYRKLGTLYIEMGELERAKAILEKALQLSEAYNIAIIKFKVNYLLYRVYKLEGDPVQSLNYLERYLRQKEAVINTQTLQVIENYDLIKKMESLEKEAKLRKEKAEMIEKQKLAEQAARLRQEFLSTMSHEIRTPLNAIITISSLLKDRSDKEDQQLLESLRFSGNNLLLLINDILDFTKLDAGKMLLENRPCNFIALLENIKTTYDGLAREKGLQLSLKTDTLIAASYKVDETKLSQILGNLISNAIKYTDHGTVSIEVEKISSSKDSDRLKFSITDTGIGIDNEHLENIFEIFFQSQSITTRKEGGTGLGLAIVKKLVGLYEQDVYVKSTLGEGSVFYFELDLEKSELPQTASVKRINELKDKTVLVAEDNIINAMVAGKLLSNWGMTTVHAQNGTEAIEKSKEKTFDFILMDIHMPEMNGFDATKYIRENQTLNSDTPIFALTADITADHQEEYVHYFNGFLRKPIEIDKLFEALSKG